MVAFFDRFRAETVYSDDLVDEFHRIGNWGDVTFPEWVDRHADRMPDQLAIRDDRDDFTWTDLQDAMRGLAAGLQERGIERGDRVAFQLSNRFEWFVCRVAIPLAGGVAVLLSPRFREKEIHHTITEASATAYVGMADYGDYDHLDIVTDVATDMDHLKTLVGVGDDLPTGVESFATLRDTPVDALDPGRIHPDLPDALHTTSGTTGLPKLYYAVQNNRMQAGKDVVGRFGITPFDHLLVFPPIQLSFGIQIGLDTAMVSGASVRVTDETEPEALWDVVETEAPDFWAAVPTQLTKMKNETDRDLDLSGLNGVIHAGSPMPEETAAYLEEQGATTANIYGISEGGMSTAVRLSDSADERLGRVGKPASSMEVKIVDEAGECGPNEVGEVIWRGAGQGFGYVNDEEKTRELFDIGGPWEGWVHSGDAGEMGEAGNVRLVGRIDNMIIRGGQNIYPPVIENELMKHDGVREAAVVGVPDEEYGERVCAFVIPAADHEVTLDELAGWLDEVGLAKYMWPERLEVVDDFPLSSAGKIQRDKLADRLDDA